MNWPHRASPHRNPQAVALGLAELLIVAGIIALLCWALDWYFLGGRQLAGAVRQARFRSMHSLMTVVEGVAADRRAEVGYLTFEDLDRLVAENLRLNEDDDGLALWTAQRDVWGRELRFERAGDGRLVIRSAGERRRLW